MSNLICLVGSSGAGKTTFSDYMKEKFQYQYFSLSKIVVESAKSEFNKTDFKREELQLFANKLREKKGNDIFAKLFLQKLENIKNDFIILDGVKHTSEINILKLKHKNLVVLAIISDKKIRFNRVLKRQRVSDPKNWDEFTICDNRENGHKEERFQQENLKCIKEADIVLHNNSTIEDYKKQIDELIISLNIFNSI